MLETPRHPVGNVYAPAPSPDGPLPSVGVNSRAMLIINADDWGGWRTATDCTLACYEAGGITSASAMVFMDDSERAARIAADTSLDVGLHLNFNQPFTGPRCPTSLLRTHEKVRRFLRINKYAQLIYHPWLCSEFRQLFEAQQEEFKRLYGRAPSHYDGHQHMHLCMNSLLGEIIPVGAKVRRSFSFWPGEKSSVNRAYRHWVDGRLKTRHLVTDYFFSLAQCLQYGRIPRVLELAGDFVVELMTHSERLEEQRFLASDQFQRAIGRVKLGIYPEIQFTSGLSDKKHACS